MDRGAWQAEVHGVAMTWTRSVANDPGWGPRDSSTVFNPWVGKIPWRREQLPSPVFWPGEFHGQRSLASFSPWGPKESNITEQLTQ